MSNVTLWESLLNNALDTVPEVNLGMLPLRGLVSSNA